MNTYKLALFGISFSITHGTNIIFSGLYPLEFLNYISCLGMIAIFNEVGYKARCVIKSVHPEARDIVENRLRFLITILIFTLPTYLILYDSVAVVLLVLPELFVFYFIGYGFNIYYHSRQYIYTLIFVDIAFKIISVSYRYYAFEYVNKYTEVMSYLVVVILISYFFYFVLSNRPKISTYRINQYTMTLLVHMLFFWVLINEFTKNLDENQMALAGYMFSILGAVYSIQIYFYELIKNEIKLVLYCLVIMIATLIFVSWLVLFKGYTNVTYLLVLVVLIRVFAVNGEYAALEYNKYMALWGSRLLFVLSVLIYIVFKDIYLLGLLVVVSELPMVCYSLVKCSIRSKNVPI